MEAVGRLDGEGELGVQGGLGPSDAEGPFAAPAVEDAAEAGRDLPGCRQP